jgi:hypothetical protein
MWSQRKERELFRTIGVQGLVYKQLQYGTATIHKKFYSTRVILRINENLRI